MEQLTIRIRPGRAEDNIRLATFGARAFSETFAEQNQPENLEAYLIKAFSPDVQASELADPASVFLLVEAGDELIGYAHLREGSAHPGVSGDRPVELARIYTRKDLIGQGIGSMLMQACLNEAGRRGCDAIWLGVWEYNPRAIEFYKKWGFQMAGTQVFALGSDLQTDLVMVRKV